MSAVTGSKHSLSQVPGTVVQGHTHNILQSCFSDKNCVLFSVVSVVSTMSKNGIERILGLFHLTGHSPLVRKSVQDPKQGRHCGGQQLTGSLSYTTQTH